MTVQNKLPNLSNLSPPPPPTITYFLINRFHVLNVDFVHTHELMAIPAPKYAKIWISVARRLGRDFRVHDVVLLLSDLAIVTLASQLKGYRKKRLVIYQLEKQIITALKFTYHQCIS